MKAALYLRVSTRDKGQTTDNQLVQLQEACKLWGYEIVEIYQDEESGGKGRKARKEFDRMLNESSGKKFDIVVFWALDRLTREGISKSIKYLSILEKNKVGFRSLQEPFLNAENELVRHILIACMSYMAQQERKRMSERVKAGLARKRQNDPTWKEREGQHGKKVLSKANRAAANDFARQMIPTINRLRKEGYRTIMALTEEMNKRGIDTASGSGRWHISSTHKLLNRIEEIA